VQRSVWELCCSLSICLKLLWLRGSACFVYDKTVINQRRIEKSVFEDQSEENSVWIIKWTTLLRIFCKIDLRLLLHLAITYTPTYTYLRRCYAILTGATGEGTSVLLTVCCILTLSTLHTRNSSCITLLWLHHNHNVHKLPQKRNSL